MERKVNGSLSTTRERGLLVFDQAILGETVLCRQKKENEKYKSTIDKFMVRHYVKPGITGLAQTKGFRGEIETNHDIINRIKYDIYYIDLIFYYY